MSVGKARLLGTWIHPLGSEEVCQLEERLVRQKRLVALGSIWLWGPCHLGQSHLQTEGEVSRNKTQELTGLQWRLSQLHAWAPSCLWAASQGTGAPYPNSAPTKNIANKITEEACWCVFKAAHVHQAISPIPELHTPHHAI